MGIPTHFSPSSLSICPSTAARTRSSRFMQPPTGPKYLFRANTRTRYFRVPGEIDKIQLRFQLSIFPTRISYLICKTPHYCGCICNARQICVFFSSPISGRCFLFSFLRLCFCRRTRVYLLLDFRCARLGMRICVIRWSYLLTLVYAYLPRAFFLPLNNRGFYSWIPALRSLHLSLFLFLELRHSFT